MSDYQESSRLLLRICICNNYFAGILIAAPLYNNRLRHSAVNVFQRALEGSPLRATSKSHMCKYKAIGFHKVSDLKL